MITLIFNDIKISFNIKILNETLILVKKNFNLVQMILYYLILIDTLLFNENFQILLNVN